MPYLPYSDLDEQRKKAEQNGQVNISGASGTLNQSAQNVAAPKPISGSGSWTNLNQYLDANKDNAETLGNSISSNISKSGNDVRTGIQNTQSDFNSQVDKGTISNLSGAKSDSDNIVGQARTAAKESQIQDDQVNRFKEVSNAAYAGPNSLDASQYYSDTQSKLDKAKNYQTNAQSDAGRFNLLEEMFAKPTYSQGQKNLDNLLISGNDTAKTGIKNAADSLNDLQGNWDKANTDAQSLAAQRLADTNAAKQYAQDLLSTNRSARTGEVDKSLTDIQNQWSNEYYHYNDLLSKYTGGELALTKDEASKLGILKQLQLPTNVYSKISSPNATPSYATPQLFNILNGVAPSAYLDLAAYDENKVIDQNQFAQLAALDKLGNQFGLTSNSRFVDPSQAGTLGLNNNFDASKFGKAQETAQQLFNQYAQGANFHSDGSNTQSWNYGPGGMFKDSLTREAHLDANLANALKQSGYNTDTTGGTYTNNYLAPGVLNDLLGKGFGSIVNGGGDLWRDGSSEAARAASETALNQAKGSLFQQIQDALNAQGFNNRAKIK